MRPTANFTLHAILAACLAALAASSAAARPKIDNEGHVYLSGQIFGSRMEVHGMTWGPRQAPLKLDRNYVKSWSTSGDAQSGGGSNELGMDDTAGKEKASSTAGRVTGIASDPAEPAGIHEVKPPRDSSIGQASERQGHSMLGASERITVGGAQTEGQATGKRTHKPFVARGIYDQAAPPPTGSLTVLTSGGACQLGARYPSLTLAGRGKSYELQDVQVADCGGNVSGPEEAITFVYGKVKVRGWDPKKKEE